MKTTNYRHVGGCADWRGCMPLASSYFVCHRLDAVVSVVYARNTPDRGGTSERSKVFASCLAAPRDCGLVIG